MTVGVVACSTTSQFPMDDAYYRPVQETVLPTQPTQTTETTQTTQTTEPAQTTPTTYYAIQICASKTPLAPNDARLHGQVCDTVHAGEWIKYFTAPDPDRAVVAQKLPELKKLFPDCWIIKVVK